MRRIRLLACVALIASTCAGAASGDLKSALAAAAPAADPQVIALAVDAMDCAARGDAIAARRLAVIDYARPSTQVRLWVFDLDRRSLLYAERVSHGQRSGDNFTTQFSNRPGSHQSSLGLFRTVDTYRGRNGYSLRLDGLEPGFNDRAMERAIVMHGAAYVSDAAIGQLGRLGRSWGCPAVRSAVARELIDQIKDGQYLFAYYPQAEWLQQSPFLSCAVHGGTRSVDAAAAAPPGQASSIGN